MNQYFGIVDVLAEATVSTSDSSPDPSFWVGGLMFFAFSLVGILQWPRFWGPAARHAKIEETFSAMGSRRSRAIGSTMPFVFVMGLSFGILLIFSDLHRLFPDALIIENIWALSGGLAAIAMFVMFSIILIGRPKFLMAPHNRHLHGLIGNLARAGARRLSRSGK